MRPRRKNYRLQAEQERRIERRPENYFREHIVETCMRRRWQER